MMELISPAFTDDEKIPEKYTCKGANLSPPLQWKNAPHKTKSYVLIMDDPDAPSGTWDHWIIYNIPSAVSSLQENNAPYTLGKNSWGKATYSGPCPPSGTHRYFFKLYALDATLTFATNPSKKEVEAAMQGHILAQATLMGTVSK